MAKEKESLQKLYVAQLKDLFSAEEQILEALPKMAKKTTHPELKRAFQEHYQQTEQQKQRLEMLGHTEHADLQQRTLDEEGDTDEKLTDLAESVVNIDALK
jgi:ferritin-like metal-binding protein YciE